MLKPNLDLTHLSMNLKFLQSLSLELAAIKTREQLQKTMNGVLKKELQFNYSTIFVLNEHRTVVNDLFYDQERAAGENPFCEYVSMGKHSADDNGYNFDDISKTRNALPYLKDKRSSPKSILLNLFEGNRVIGHWVVLYKADRAWEANQPDGDLLLLLANQLSIVVSKIMRDVAIIERETEIEIIQSLNVDFVSVREKNDLLKVIHVKLKKLFDFGHHWVAVINEDQLTMTSFLQEPASKAKNHPKYQHVLKAKYPINDRIFNKVLLSNQPQVFDLDQLSARSNMPEYMQILYESGIQKIVMISLQVGDKVIGVWAICLVSNQEMSVNQLNLVKGISLQLSIAVANIIANLSIKEKEEERELLLKLGFAITTVRTRHDLVNILNTNLRKLLAFKDIVIIVLNDASDNDYCLNKVMEAEGIVVFDMENLYRREDRPDYIRVEYEQGIREKVGIALRDDGKNTGVLFVNSIVEGRYTDHNLEVITGISYQLSTMLSNILANEEIVTREKERELLLSLSIDFAAIRNTNELVLVITQRLKDLMGFYHSAIATIDEDQTAAKAYILDPESKSKTHRQYQDVISNKHPLNDGILDRIVTSPSPMVVDLDQLAKESEIPLWLRVNYESGIRQLVAVRFSKGSQVFGFWLIYFVDKIPMDERKLSLIESLANQISISVSNIIANEEAAKRGEEKAMLLSFSHAIATVRDKKGLERVIKQYLKNLFLISEYIITIKNDDHETHSYFLHGLEPDTPSDKMFQLITQSGVPISGSMTGVKLKVAEEDIGILWIEPGRINDHLLNGITALIAIALANAIANDKIEKQLIEINRYKRQLEEEKIYLKEEIETSHNYSEIVGSSSPMQTTFRLVSQVAPSDSTVLILGETGTGKELIARAIHNGSPRKNKLMVKVNCAALPANLIESELFGHERGSFTGATDRRLGKFELANGGTLFLDEIGEMPLELQVKLLRALQEREIERVGGRSTIKVDVRIIAATNRELEKEMEEGRFRSDLYYRLNIFPISLPPLRDRREDIPLLTSHFIQRYAKKTGRNIKALNSGAMQELMQYNWPGNIRELEHLIERSILQSTGDTVKQIHLPLPKHYPASAKEDFVPKTIDQNEREFILKTIKHCGGRISGEGGAALLLGVPPSTLNSKMKRLGIRKEHIG